MSAQIDIVNMALTHLGVRLLASMNENSEAARRATVLWTPSRQEVLRGANWNFATKILTLALSGSDVVVGYDFVYVYPSNCLKVRRLFNQVVAIGSLAAIPEWLVGSGNFDEQRMVQDKDFREMIGPTSGNQVLVSRLSSAYAEITYDVIDTTRFDALFVKAMSFKLAAELARPLVGDADLQAKMENKYLAQISEAKRVDRSEGQDKARAESSFFHDR